MNKYTRRAVAFTLFFFGVYFLTVNYLVDKHSQIIKARLLGYASSYSNSLETLGYEKLDINTKPDNPLYQSMIDLEMKWLQNNSFISDIYTMNLTDDHKPFFLVDSETDYDRNNIFEGEREQRTRIGEIYEKDLPEIKEGFLGKSVFVEKPYSDKWGDWLSTFVPIRANNGKVLGILGVDYQLNQFKNEIGRTVYAVFGIFFLLYVIMLKVWLTRLSSIEYTKGLKTALKETEIAKNAKMQLVSHLSHEIRTPLNGIVSVSKLIQDEGLSKQENADYLNILNSCSNQLVELVNDILDYSKLEAGKVKIEKTQFDLAELIDESINTVADRLIAKNLKLIKKIQFDLHDQIIMDKTKLRQILVNLLSNAAKFTDFGTISLHISRNRNEFHDRLVFKITDTGVGIPKDKLSRVFSEYDQLDAVNDKKHGGTGLGLSISKKLVSTLGGEIKVTSKEGKGTSFSFFVPLETGKTRVVERADKPKKLLENTSLRILVVDDVDVNRLVFSRFLKKIGFQCDVAENGEQALDKFLIKDYDLIFMDCNMPIIDGYTATQKIKKIKSQCIVVAVTASVNEEEKNKCLSCGMDAYLTKPIRINEIEFTIGKYFPHVFVDTKKAS